MRPSQINVPELHLSQEQKTPDSSITYHTRCIIQLFCDSFSQTRKQRSISSRILEHSCMFSSVIGESLFTKNRSSYSKAQQSPMHALTDSGEWKCSECSPLCCLLFLLIVSEPSSFSSSFPSIQSCGIPPKGLEKAYTPNMTIAILLLALLEQTLSLPLTFIPVAYLNSRTQQVCTTTRAS